MSNIDGIILNGSELIIGKGVNENVDTVKQKMGVDFEVCSEPELGTFKQGFVGRKYVIRNLRTVQAQNVKVESKATTPAPVVPAPVVPAPVVPAPAVQAK